jgi:hypothetical protein
MAGKVLIKTGVRCGSRTVIAVDRSNSQRPMVHCRCDCGKEATVSATSFRRSPNCMACHKGKKKRKYRQFAIKYPLYHTWSQVRRRCRDRNTDHSKYYGDKGIGVCQEWDKSFLLFEEWALANGYQPGLAIDRIDSRRNYEPENCEWVTRKENGRRMRATYHFVRTDALSSSSFLSFGS